MVCKSQRQRQHKRLDIQNGIDIPAINSTAHQYLLWNYTVIYIVISVNSFTVHLLREDLMNVNAILFSIFHFVIKFAKSSILLN